MNGRANKKIIIGGLLAALCVMAVAYATFSTQLTINASSSVDSVWDVRYNTSNAALTNYNITTGISGASAPSSNDVSIVFSESNTVATLTAHLYQPGDVVTFTLTVENHGTLPAQLSKSSIVPTGCVVGTDGQGHDTCSNGHIMYTVYGYSKNVLNPAQSNVPDTATIQVKAEFVESGETISIYTAGETASIDLTLNAVQYRN